MNTPDSTTETPSRLVDVNGPRLIVRPRSERPMMLHESVATLTHPATGERIEISRSVSNPFFFQMTGDLLTVSIDIAPLMQEAALHVEARNGVPSA